MRETSPPNIFRSRLALAKPRVAFFLGRHAIHGLRGVFDVAGASFGFWVWGRWDHAVPMLANWLKISQGESQHLLLASAAVALAAAILIHWRLSAAADRVHESFENLRREQKAPLAELEAQAESIKVGRSAGGLDRAPRRPARRL